MIFIERNFRIKKHALLHNQLMLSMYKKLLNNEFENVISLGLEIITSIKYFEQILSSGKAHTEINNEIVTVYGFNNFNFLQLMMATAYELSGNFKKATQWLDLETTFQLSEMVKCYPQFLSWRIIKLSELRLRYLLGNFEPSNLKEAVNDLENALFEPAGYYFGFPLSYGKSITVNVDWESGEFSILRDNKSSTHYFGSRGIKMILKDISICINSNQESFSFAFSQHFKCQSGKEVIRAYDKLNSIDL